jgi:hypothetical protein
MLEETHDTEEIVQRCGRVPWSGGNEGVVVMLSDVLGAGR